MELKNFGKGTGMGRDYKMLWSLLVGMVFVLVMIAGLYPMIWGEESGKFLVLNDGASIYHGKLTVEKVAPQNLTQVIPNLRASTRHYSYRDAGDIARALGMKYPEVFDRGNNYIVSSAGSTLLVNKNGTRVMYWSREKLTKNVTMSDYELEKIARQYVEKLKIALPWGVRLVPHVTDGIPAPDGGYYTRIVNYYAYFQDFRVGLEVKMEIDGYGHIYGFNSTPFIVESAGYMKIASFTSAYKWLENRGIPVPVSAAQVRGVVLRMVHVYYELYDGHLVAGYNISARAFYGIDNYVDYTVNVLWVPK